jgi:hydroxyacylglutathione hydrolase
MRRGETQFTLQDTLILHVLPGFQDNYFYIVENPSLRCAAVVDPGDSRQIETLLTTKQLNLTHLLLTHHHRDHTGGALKLLTKYPHSHLVCSPWMDLNALLPQSSRVSRLCGAESLALWDFQLRGMDVRGHTLDHVAFCIFKKESPERLDVFVGDALFGAGCGGLFEGTFPQMLEALRRLRSLPAEARLWCAHEYTLKNLRVAVQLGEPNAALAQRLECLESRVEREKIEPHEWMTIPLLLEEELQTNPFLRWDSPTLQKAVDTQDDLATFTHVRRFRDRF